MLFIHKTFLVYKLETFKNCKEVKHMVIMIIAVIYIFLSSVIFDQQLKITFRKSLAPSPWKNHSPLFTHSLPPPKKIKKCKSPLFANIENFSGPPCREQGFSMTAFITMMLSVVDLFFFPAVCILDMLLCTTSFWFFFTISYALDTIFVMKIPLWLS